jgi:hypothetical protein
MMRLNLSILIVDMLKEDPEGVGGKQGRKWHFGSTIETKCKRNGEW